MTLHEELVERLVRCHFTPAQAEEVLGQTRATEIGHMGSYYWDRDAGACSDGVHAVLWFETKRVALASIERRPRVVVCDPCGDEKIAPTPRREAAMGWVNRLLNKTAKIVVTKTGRVGGGLGEMRAVADNKVLGVVRFHTSYSRARRLRIDTPEQAWDRLAELAEAQGYEIAGAAPTPEGESER